MFCGSCAVESKLQGFEHIICNDKHEYLIEMFKALQNGYELPETITKEEYQYIKEHKDKDKALAGFTGFACSFGGKWFGGYAKNSANRNYCAGGKRTVMKSMENLMDATFTCNDYRKVQLPEGCVVFADPPYAETTQYGEKFDSEEFWEYMRTISKTHKVYVCEQNAPDDFVAIWEQPLKRTLDVNKSNYFTVIEKLYIPKTQFLPGEQSNDRQKKDGE